MGNANGEFAHEVFFRSLGTLSIPSDAQVDLTGVAYSSGVMTTLTNSCFPVQSVHVGSTRLI